MKLKSKNIFYFATILSVIIISEFFLQIFDVDIRFFPYPSMVFEEIYKNYSDYIVASFSTIKIVFYGLLPAILFGWIFAFTSHESKYLHFIVHPIVSFSQLVPKTALIPVFISINFLGYTWKSNVLITFLISFFPVYIDVFLGLTLLKSDYLLLFQSLAATRSKTIKYLKIPFTLPYLLNGINVAALYSVIGAVTSEILIGKDGLGYLIDYSCVKLNNTRAFAGLFFCVLLGIAIQLIILIVKKTLLISNYEDREN